MRHSCKYFSTFSTTGNLQLQCSNDIPDGTNGLRIVARRNLIPWRSCLIAVVIAYVSHERLCTQLAQFSRRACVASLVIRIRAMQQTWNSMVFPAPMPNCATGNGLSISKMVSRSCHGLNRIWPAHALLYTGARSMQYTRTDASLQVSHARHVLTREVEWARWC